MLQYKQRISTGLLEINVVKAKIPMKEILTFGARQNPKRGYLFISKVLGKYVPCHPHRMRWSYRLLVKHIAFNIHKNENIHVLGVAETAIGLGAGIAQELKTLMPEQYITYCHTTRYNIDSDLDFSIQESHSHAPSHLIYKMYDKSILLNMETIIIVDDEISTGKTLLELTKNLYLKSKSLKKIIWVSLVNWLSDEIKILYQSQFPEHKLQFVELLSGSFKFHKEPSKNIILPKHTATEVVDINSRSDIGRTGNKVSTNPSYTFLNISGKPFNIKQLNNKEKYSIIGTGEFTYLPFLLAENLEEQGIDIVYQSTGRSPMYEGCGVLSKNIFYDHGHQAYFYLYNYSKERIPIICYETMQHYQNCTLNESIKGLCLVLK